MKNLFNLLAIAAILAIAVSACSDPCTNTDCGTNGECVEGTCVCDSNYMGSDCSQMLNSLFVGTYVAQWTCSAGGSATDTVTVVVGNAPDAVIFQDFNGIRGNDIGMTISENDDLVIAQQTTAAGNAYSWSGTRSNSVLSFTLNKSSDTCQVTMTKQ